jgi:hypothetical protein
MHIVVDGQPVRSPGSLGDRRDDRSALSRVHQPRRMQAGAAGGAMSASIGSVITKNVALFSDASAFTSAPNGR